MLSDNWGKVFKNGPSKTCGRQLLKNLRGYSLLKIVKHAQTIRRQIADKLFVYVWPF